MNTAISIFKEQLREDRSPLYLKIATQMRREVESGNWKPGYRLQSLASIAEDLGVAVVTIRQAVALLEQEGLLIRKQGLGTFVTEAPPTQRWIVLGSDWSSLLGHLEGKKPHLVQMADTIGQPTLSSGDGTAAESYKYMRRVHYWDDKAYALINIYLDRAVYRMAPKQFAENMVISTLAKTQGINAKNMRQTISFTTADPETAAMLKISVNAPIGEVRRVITDPDGKVIYVGETKYRGDFVKLEMNLER
ncbi:MAG: GntR family transcriptional regulator [Alphaproteobacteria bacterium]